MVIDFNLFTYNQLTVDEKLEAKIAYGSYVNDKSRWQRYNMSYKLYMENIINSLIEMQKVTCLQLIHVDSDI